MDRMNTWKITAFYNNTQGFEDSYDFEFSTPPSASIEEAQDIGEARASKLIRRKVTDSYIKQLVAETEYLVYYTVGTSDHREMVLNASNKATAMFMAITYIEEQGLEITGKITCINNS